VVARSDIIAVRSPQHSDLGTTAGGTSPVGAHKAGKSSAQPGLVT
jgi:hypothetical protein